jgi:ubiquitin carboxyl-terminal hydrolase 4/11/15
MLTLLPDASVTKLKDTSRVVTSAAYLLFYRRRSDVPLGGPKFQEIFDRFNNQTGPDDNMSDSGEGQRLGQGSSQRGSPSASTGAGPALPRASRGWDRRGGGGDDNDTDMGTWSNQDTLHTSIECDGEDEGIGLSEYDAAGLAGMTSVIGPSNWSFDNLVSKPGSEAGEEDADIASDVAQNDGSSVNADDFDDVVGGPTGDMEMLLQQEPGAAGFGEAAEPPTIEFATDDYAPPSYLSRIAADAWVKQQVSQQMIHTVPLGADDDDAASDKVAEIHVGGEAEEEEAGKAADGQAAAAAPPAESPA